MRTKQKKGFLIFIIILLLALNAGCLDVPVLKVRVNIITSPEGNPVIKDITAEQTSVGVLSRPRQPPPSLPGIYCRVLKQTDKYLTATGFWPSVPYTGAGSYELIVDFQEPPNKGENLRILINIYNKQGGDPVTSEYINYEWK